MLEDKQLMLRWNHGDLAALRCMYDKYKHELVTLAAALLYNRQIAEDIVHDLFARLIERQDRLKIKNNLRSYLMRAVANAARSLNASGSKLPAASLDAMEFAQPGPQPTAEQEIASKELQKEVVQALSQLPYEQRETVMLRHFSCMPFKEIAAAQKVSINTAQGRYRYGMEKLRSILNGELQK